MSGVKFRIAKPSDAKQIANCHWRVRDRYTKGFFLSMGKSFLVTYYKIVLDDPWEVIVCAESESGQIVGFASTTMNSKKQMENLKKHKLKLFISAIFAIIKKPFLIKEILLRFKSLNSKNGSVFFSNSGVRGEYWCWLKDEESLKSVEMSKVKNNILYDLGIREINFEVDKFNTAVYKYHLKVNKAEPIEEKVLPDGRVRVLMKKVLYKDYGN